MSLPWSISTTVRNPERIPDFVRTLKELEGRAFDQSAQIRFQILLIKNRLYKPSHIPDKYKKLISEPNSEITEEQAGEIFDFQEYEDPAMRGRQSANPLNKLGFSIARASAGEIRITELGNFIISGGDFSEAIFKSLLKLQFPNPWTKDFNTARGFNIRPFIASLRLLDLTGKMTKTEFSLFVPTLTHYKDIKKQAGLVRQYRSARSKEAFADKFLMGFYGTAALTAKQRNNIYDYGDNIMRYFRLTKFFRVSRETLKDWTIAPEPLRMEETRLLIEKYDGSAAKDLNDEQNYLRFLSDINEPPLPWDRDRSSRRSVADFLISRIKTEFAASSVSADSSLLSRLKKLDSFNTETESDSALSGHIEALRAFRLDFVDLARGGLLRKNFGLLPEISAVLTNKKSLRGLEPFDFEHLIAKCFKIINDEILIKANCLLDDDGNPISFAPGNLPDIEAYYETFNCIVEATLDVSRNQVYRESMPVMRHLKIFSEKHTGKSAYCLFTAPEIHSDTVNYFWIANKFGFEGVAQNIVPLKTEWLTNIFKTLSAETKHAAAGNQMLKALFSAIADGARTAASSLEWISGTPEILKSWKEKIISQ
jgi:hypothetical protein